MKNLINIGSFIIMIALERLWIEIDQIFLPQYLLMPAFLVIVFILLTIYFFIVRPDNIRRFTLFLSLATCTMAILLTLVQHIIIVNDFKLVWKKSLMIWAFTFILPGLVGFGYSKLGNRQKINDKAS